MKILLITIIAGTVTVCTAFSPKYSMDLKCTGLDTLINPTTQPVPPDIIKSNDKPVAPFDTAKIVHPQPDTLHAIRS